MRFPTINQGAGRLVHRQCTDRSLVSAGSTGTHSRRQCHVRAGRPHGVAHASLGQAWIVTSGCGWTQCWSEPTEKIQAGDAVQCPHGYKHWHGATPTARMTQIAIQEALDGKVIEGMEKVTDKQYLAAPTNK